MRVVLNSFDIFFVACSSQAFPLLFGSDSKSKVAHSKVAESAIIMRNIPIRFNVGRHCNF